MTKFNKQQAALSHARAYITDIDWKNAELIAAVSSCNTIKELLAVQAQFPITRRYDVKGFYQAMLLVCPILHRESGYAEHSGTECRGWFRVWGSIKLDTGYFCQFDLGRDQSMAMTFLEAGAITANEYRRYQTMMTLNQALNVVQEDGTIDVSKMRNYWKPEYHSKVFNLDVLQALETI